METLPFAELMRELIGGLWVSILIFLGTLLFAIPLGMLVALGRMSRCSVVRWLFQIYISIMRGTPLMLQLIVCFFGPYYMFGMALSGSYRYTAVIIAFSLNYAAYFAEIFRSGFRAIPVGQHEAALVLGYNSRQTFFRIILPQVVKRVIPPVTNEVITLVKDTSLAFSLSVLEMFTIAKQLSSTYTSMVPLITAGVFYYIFNAVVAWVMHSIEKKLDYYR